MRNRVHDVISQDFGKFYGALVYHGMELNKKGDETTIALEVLQQIRDDLWAGEEAIRVLAEDQKIRFQICQANGSVQVIEPESAVKEIITLRLFSTGCHYEPIIPDSAKERRAWSNSKYCKQEKSEEQRDKKRLKKRLGKEQEQKRKIEDPIDINKIPIDKKRLRKVEKLNSATIENYFATPENYLATAEDYLEYRIGHPAIHLELS